MDNVANLLSTMGWTPAGNGWTPPNLGGDVYSTAAVLEEEARHSGVMGLVAQLYILTNEKCK